ncbi:hypothetical protein D9M69_697920 [compost metagenome]
MENDLLGVRCFVGQNASATNFRARSRGCWHSNDRCNCVAVSAGPPVPNVFKIPDIAGLACLKCDKLAKIKRRTTAKCNHTIMLAFVENLDASIKIALDRVRLHIGKNRIFDASRIKNGECGSDDW